MDYEKFVNSEVGRRNFLAIWKRMRLFDDRFFSVFFRAHPEEIGYLLRAILDKPDLEIIEVLTQDQTVNKYGKSVTFDISAMDKENRLYNIEVQRDSSGAIAVRARYHSSIFDYRTLDRNKGFKDLPETFVIFITEHDVLKGGLPIYHIDRVIRELGRDFDDGTHIIYVNGSYNFAPGDPLGDWMHDFFCRTSGEMRIKRLVEKIEYEKSDEGTWVSVSDREFYQGIFGEENFGQMLNDAKNEGKAEGIAQGRAEGIAQGKAEGIIIGVRAFMETLNMTASQAMDKMKISSEEREKLLPLI